MINKHKLANELIDMLGDIRRNRKRCKTEHDKAVNHGKYLMLVEMIDYIIEMEDES